MPELSQRMREILDGPDVDHDGRWAEARRPQKNQPVRSIAEMERQLELLPTLVSDARVVGHLAVQAGMIPRIEFVKPAVPTSRLLPPRRPRRPIATGWTLMRTRLKPAGVPAPVVESARKDNHQVATACPPFLNDVNRDIVMTNRGQLVLVDGHPADIWFRSPGTTSSYGQDTVLRDPQTIPLVEHSHLTPNPLEISTDPAHNSIAFIDVELAFRSLAEFTRYNHLVNEL